MVPRPEEPEVAAGPRGSRRGTYDRHASPSERAREQRAELLLAVRQVVVTGNVPTVSSIASARGLGRNTFYEHFSTVEAAVEAAVDEAAALLAQTLARAWDDDLLVTPSERTRRFSTALVGFVDERADRWVLLGEHGDERLEQTLRAGIAEVRASFVAAGSTGGVWSDLKMAGASGAVRGILGERARGAANAAEITEELVSVLGRLLR